MRKEQKSLPKVPYFCPNQADIQVTLPTHEVSILTVSLHQKKTNLFHTKIIVLIDSLDDAGVMFGEEDPLCKHGHKISLL